MDKFRRRVSSIDQAPSIPPYVDLGLPSGIKWATCNIGSDTPEGEGLFFSWANGIGLNPSTYVFSDANYRSTVGYSNNNNNVPTNSTYDGAVNYKGDGYRLPTSDDWNELKNNTTRTLETVNGQICIKCTSKISGYTDKYILLPKLGRKDGSSRNTAPMYYWSANYYTSDSTKAYCAYSSSGSSNYNVTLTSRRFGMPIRAVYETPSGGDDPIIPDDPPTPTNPLTSNPSKILKGPEGGVSTFSLKYNGSYIMNDDVQNVVISQSGDFFTVLRKEGRYADYDVIFDTNITSSIKTGSITVEYNGYTLTISVTLQADYADKEWYVVVDLDNFKIGTLTDTNNYVGRNYNGNYMDLTTTTSGSSNATYSPYTESCSGIIYVKRLSKYRSGRYAISSTTYRSNAGNRWDQFECYFDGFAYYYYDSNILTLKGTSYLPSNVAPFDLLMYENNIRISSSISNTTTGDIYGTEDSIQITGPGTYTSELDLYFTVYPALKNASGDISELAITVGSYQYKFGHFKFEYTTSTGTNPGVTSNTGMYSTTASWTETVSPS